MYFFISQTRLLPWLPILGSVFALCSSQSSVIRTTGALKRDNQYTNAASIKVQETDFHWFTKISIGGQVFSVLIDTGSSALWVPGSNVSGHHGQPTYDPKKSTTRSIVPNISFSEIFPNNHASGTVFRDTVAFPDTDAVVKNFVFGVANDVSTTFLKEPYDGVLGMGFAQRASPSLESQPPLFQMLMPELEFPVFAMNFRGQSAKSRNAPIMEIGRIDHTKYAGKLTRVPINSTTGHWATKNVTFSIRGQHMHEGADLIFDTGADATINAPFSVVDQYYRNLSGLAGGYQQALKQGLEYAGPCTLVAPCNLAWPNIDLHLGDGIAEIHGNFMSGRTLGNDTHPMRQNGTDLCMPTLQPFSDGSAAADDVFDCPLTPLIGHPFFKEQYVIFNQAEPSISYAPYAKAAS